jgi:hypothetical protein
MIIIISLVEEKIIIKINILWINQNQKKVITLIKLNSTDNSVNIINTIKNLD